jgi:hypothetical protein
VPRLTGRRPYWRGLRGRCSTATAWQHTCDETAISTAYPVRVTLPTAKTKGLFDHADETELCVGCPPEPLGAEVSSYLTVSARRACCGTPD